MYARLNGIFAAVLLCLPAGLIVSGFGCRAYSAPLPPVVKVPRYAVSERLDTSSQSGGVNIVGLVPSDFHSQMPYNGIILSVGGLPINSKTICISITSVSGLYHVNFNIPNPHLGPVVALEVPITKSREAGKLVGEFAVQASSGSGKSCDQTRLPVAWSRQRPVAQQFLAINALDAVSVRILSPDHQITTCRRMNDPSLDIPASMVAFSHLCEVSTNPSCERSFPYSILTSNTAGANDPVQVLVTGKCQGKN